MSDWVYVASEDGFFQDFILINHSTNEQIDLTGGVLTMFIQSADFQTDFPSDGNGTPMTIVPVSSGTAGRLAVSVSFMPQTEGMYYAQIKLQQASILRSFLVNLRVIRKIGN